MWMAPFVPWHWRCHFIPCLGHKASRASVDAANETIAAEPMQGSCRQESASLFSLVTSDSVPSQEPGTVWLRILIIAENTPPSITGNYLRWQGDDNRCGNYVNPRPSMYSDSHNIYKFALISRFLCVRTWKRLGSCYLPTVQRNYTGRVSGEGSWWKEEGWLTLSAWLLFCKRPMTVWITCVSDWAEPPEAQCITEARNCTLWAKQISRSPWPNKYWRLLFKSYLII